MRLTDFQRSQVDRCVLDANLGRLTEFEAIDLVKHRLGVQIDKWMIRKRRYHLKKQTDRMWEYYRKDNFAYKRLHSELMAECEDSLRIINGEIQQYKDDPKKFFHLHRCLRERLEWNQYKRELVKDIPAIDSLVHTDKEGNDINYALEYTQNEGAGQAIPSGRVF